MPRLQLSVVVPAYNEAGNIEAVAREALAKLAPLAAFEIIFVDDGSSDETGAVLEKLARAEPRLRVIRHGKRSGKSAALRSGMVEARAFGSPPWTAMGRTIPPTS